MGNKVKQSVEFDFSANIDNLENSLSKINGKLGKINIPKSAETNIKKIINDIQKEILNVRSKNEGGIVDLLNVKDIEKSNQKIQSAFAKLKVITKDFSNTSIFDGMIKEIHKYETSLETLNTKVKNATTNKIRAQAKIGGKKPIDDIELTNKKQYLSDKKSELSNKKTYIKDNKSEYKKIQKIDVSQRTDAQNELVKSYDQATVSVQKLSEEIQELEKITSNALPKSEFDSLKNTIEQSTKEIEDAEKALKELKNANPFDRLKEQLKNIGVDTEGVDSLDKIKEKLNSLTPEQISKLPTELQKFNNELRTGGRAAKAFGNQVEKDFKSSADAVKQSSDRLQEFTGKLKMFFGMTNGVQLFKRALKESFESVKELDAAMTKIAVVSEYDISDMWSSLPQFTKNANALGVAITEVYDATGLYVQQGLDLVESQGLANETLKMAKIAGMDAAAATDAMTSALRGFNMELNQGSAEKVNDIYSKLAAITASDTQEIATAMSKTASIANNAGASIENTSAFLSMIIETTRESAETAGTALKTVIARFSELKKNPAEIGDVDGEIVDANAIETALRLANVDLRDATGQFRNFDEVIIELSGKWDSLDKNTQRYIATMAAGSRQQSRFLALMSDNERLLQLTDAAYNSAGASQQQFNKTLDSMESKLNQLKNAWDTFTRNLMNSELIKFGVDLLTGILTAINGITSAFQEMGPLIGSVLSTSTIAAFFLMAKKSVDKLTHTLEVKMQEKLKQITNTASTEGGNTGRQYGLSVTNEADKIIDPWIQKMQQKLVDLKNGFAMVKGGKKITAKPTSETPQLTDEERYKQLLDKQGTKADGTLNRKGLTKADNAFAKEYEKNHPVVVDKKEVQQAEKGLKKYGVTTQTVAGATMALGFASSLLAQSLRKEGADEAADKVEHFGSVLTGVGTTIYVLIPLLGKLKTATNKPGFNKWALILTAVAIAIALIVDLFKAWAKNTPEGKLKALTKQTEKATAAAQKAQEVYSNWLSDKNEYTGLLDTIKELTEGTETWTQKMQEAKDKVYEMINAYPELAMYVDEDGMLGEEGINKYNEKITEQKEMAMGAKIIAEMAEKTQKYEVDRSKLETERDEILKNLTPGTEEYNKKEALYVAKLEQLAIQYEKTYEGLSNYMTQVAGAKGYIADNLSAVYTQKSSGGQMTNKVAQYKQGAIQDYQNRKNEQIAMTGVGAATGAVAGAMAATTFGTALTAVLAKVGIANSWNVVGWAALIGAAVVGTATYLIEENRKQKELEELQEEYSEIFGIDVDKISEDIKNDADALASQIANGKAFKEYRENVENSAAEIATMGANAQKLFSVDLTLLDEDFSDFGGLEEWANNLKNGVSEFTQDAIDDAVKKFKAEKREVTQALYDTFGGKVELTIDADIIAGDITISNKQAQRFKNAQKALQDSFGSTAAIDKVIGDYGLTQNSVDELTNAYIKLGEAATVTQQALVAKELIESGQENLAQLGMTFATVNAEVLSTTNQVKQFYMGLSVDQMNELFKNGKITAESLYELKDGFGDLGGIVDTTGVSFATLGDVFNDLRSGILSIDDLTQGYIETLDKLNKSEHILEDAMAKAAAFKDPTSSTNIGEIGGKVAQSLKEIISERRLGDPAAQTYFDYLFGEDAWDKALKLANGNAEVAMAKYAKTIKTLAEEQNYFNIWASTAKDSGGLWTVGEDGYTIKFNLDGIKDLDEYIEEISKKTGWTQEFARQAIADAEAWSPSLTSDLSAINATSAFADYINNLEKVGDTVFLNEAQLSKLYKEGIAGKNSNFGSEEEFINAVKEQLGKEYKIKANDGTVEDKNSDLLATFKEQNASKAFSSDAMVQEEAKESYKELLSQLVSNFVAEGYSVRDAITKVQQEYGTDEMMAAAFGASYSEEAKENFLGSDFGKDIAEFFDDSEIATWVDASMTDEEANLVKQADLINQGTLKAVDYYLAKVGNTHVNEIDPKEFIIGSVTAYNKSLSKTQEVSEEEKRKEESEKIEFSEEVSDFLGIELPKVSDSYTQTAEMLESAAEFQFDWLHNLNQLAEKAVHNLEKLEKELEIGLKKMTMSTDDIANNLAEQYANIEAEKQVAKETARLAQERMDNYVTENTGLAKYVQKQDDGRVTIDWNALYAARADGDLTEAAEKYLDELVTDQKLVNDNIQLQLDKELEQLEFLEEIDNTIIDFESQVRDMIISQYEKEIDELSQIDSSINDANSKLVNSIQKSLNRSRQNRDNEKTEKNITDMQNRLALLRADTTGANRQEIMELEEQLGEAQEDYTDTLIDQKISELQEQNEEASQQRQEQIAIAEEQLKSAQENGQINQKVQDILAASQKFDGSPLQSLWIAMNGNQGLSGMEWAKNIQKFKEDAANYYGTGSFKEQYVGGKSGGGINEDVATKVAKALGISKEFGLQDLRLDKALSGLDFTKFIDYLKKLIGDEDSNSSNNNNNNNDNGNKTTTTTTTTTTTQSPKSLQQIAEDSGLSELIKYKSNVISESSSEKKSFENMAYENGYSDKEIQDYYLANLGNAAGIRHVTEMGNYSKNNITDGYYASERPMIVSGKKSHLFQVANNGKNWFAYDGKGFVDWPYSERDIFNAIFPGALKKIHYFNANANYYKRKYSNYDAYETGGLNTYTGPAWLDGTPSKPELVLNATDTENFLQLKDILASIMNGTAFNTTNQKDGDINLEIHLNVEQGISSDYDVEQLVTKVKQEIARVGRERNIQILTKR